jgi:uncharacterized membrane protein
MRVSENLELIILAPIEQVWEAFQDFTSWPKWSTYLKRVERVDDGWRFVARGMPPIDLIWVARAVRRDPPVYVEFESVPGAEHDLEVKGRVELEDEEGKTHLRMHFEGQPHFKRPWMNGLADVYTGLFGEPNKLLKVTMEEFKQAVEAEYVGASRAEGLESRANS